MSQIKLSSPLSEKAVRSLKIGDEVIISGTIFTGRDAVHKALSEGAKFPPGLKDGIIFHCGPIITGRRGNWSVIACGPTTSARAEPYQADVIKRLGIRAIIGKGGMGKNTLDACRSHGAVYLHAIGGAAQIYARNVKKVINCYMEEFGMPEAMWELFVEDFYTVVTMDSNGNSLHDEVEKASLACLNKSLI